MLERREQVRVARTYREGATDAAEIRRLYATARNLDAKYKVVRDFALASVQFEEFVLEELSLAGDEHVLDIGCGSGRFLLPLARRASEKRGYVVGCDISAGVMTELERVIAAERLQTSLLVAGAESLPFLDESFDVVMANHMLYHVEDIYRALQEARRVLRRGGRFVATTNGRDGMPELHRLQVETMRELDIPYDPTPDDSFSLETGRERLESVFADVELHAFEAGFAAPNPDPIVAYYKATRLFQGPFEDESLSREQRDLIEPVFRRRAAADIAAAGGTLIVSRPMGAFVATWR